MKKYSKPVVKNVSMVLDQRCLNIQQGNSFDEFINITLPYFKEGKRLAITINYPIKLTKRNKKYKDWIRRESVVIEKINNNFYLDIIYQKPKPKLRETGEDLAFDFGVKKLLTSSRGEFLGTEIEKICNEITNCERNSKHYKRLLRKRSQYIDKTVKDLNLKNVKRIFIEDLKDLKRDGKKKGKTRRSFRNRFQYCLQVRTQKRLQNLCEEQGIELVKVSPAYTSQTCSRCGAIDKSSRDQENYHCSTCGYEIDADLNGAINILRRGVYSPSSTEKLKSYKTI